MIVNFLTVDDVLYFHTRELENHGGQEGIRDHAALEAAVEQPKQTWSGEYLYPTHFDMAAAYAFHIAESQAFVDGNKRTAVVSSLTFLAMNGYEINECRMEIYEAMIAIAKKELDKEGLSELLRNLAIESISE